MQIFLILIAIFLSHVLCAQDTTKVAIDLTMLANEEVSVKVFPPDNKTNWKFVIPEIIPGTYMKINYVRFYKKLRAYDSQGNRLKVLKKKIFLKSEENSR